MTTRRRKQPITPRALRPDRPATAASLGAVPVREAGAGGARRRRRAVLGEVLAVDDPALLRRLGGSGGSGDGGNLTLLRSERAMTDCRPVSLFSLQTGGQLGEEIGVELDKRRFRANLYLDLGPAASGFAEDALVGRSLRIGAKAVIAVLERDPRCKMITLDPDRGEANLDLLCTVTRAHDGMAGVYGAMLVEGTVRPGDAVELLN